MNDRTERRLTVDDFPIDLHRRLKSTAALDGVSMRAACIEAIREWCTEREVRASRRRVAERAQAEGQQLIGGVPAGPSHTDTAAAKGWRRRDE